MERLDGQIKKELVRFGPADATSGGDMVALVRAWPAAVGVENARRSWPARFARDGTLVVHAADSVWAFQLGMLAAEMLERLRRELGAAAPMTIKFVVGPLPEPAARTSVERPSTLPRIGAEETAAGLELAAGIENEELRALVARVAAASLARARSGRSF